MERVVENALSTTSTKRGFMRISLPSDEELMQMGVAYQEGGKYPPEARMAEDRYIYDNIHKIISECEESNSQDNEYTYLEDVIGKYRGTWQCRYGFYRSIQVIERVEVEEVLALATRVIGSDKVDSWLNNPTDNFGGSSPNDLIKAKKWNKVKFFLRSIDEGY